MPVINTERCDVVYLRNRCPGPLVMHITSPSRMTTLNDTMFGSGALVEDGGDEHPVDVLLIDTNEDGDDMVIHPGEIVALYGNDLMSRAEVAGIRRLIDSGALEIVNSEDIDESSPLMFGARSIRLDDESSVDMASFARLQDRTWWKQHYRHHPEWFEWMTDEQKKDAANPSLQPPTKKCRCPNCEQEINPSMFDGGELVSIDGRTMDVEVIDIFPGIGDHPSPIGEANYSGLSGIANRIATRLQQDGEGSSGPVDEEDENAALIQMLKQAGPMSESDSWMGDRLVGQLMERFGDNEQESATDVVNDAQPPPTSEKTPSLWDRTPTVFRKPSSLDDCCDKCDNTESPFDKFKDDLGGLSEDPKIDVSNDSPTRKSEPRQKVDRETVSFLVSEVITQVLSNFDVE
jgi:hypothetical protein